MEHADLLDCIVSLAEEVPVEIVETVAGRISQLGDGRWSELPTHTLQPISQPEVRAKVRQSWIPGSGRVARWRPRASPRRAAGTCWRPIIHCTAAFPCPVSWL